MNQTRNKSNLVRSEGREDADGRNDVIKVGLNDWGEGEMVVQEKRV